MRKIGVPWVVTSKVRKRKGMASEPAFMNIET